MVIRQIRKRNGMMVDFDLKKIINAIQKGMIASDHQQVEDAEMIAEKVHQAMLAKRDNQQDYIPNVEDVQDIVEEQLMES